MKQSLECIGEGDVITIIGFVGGSVEDRPGLAECLSKQCTVRFIAVGDKRQMEDMCHAIEATPERLKPVVDPKVFELDDLKAAYEYQWSAKH